MHQPVRHREVPILRPAAQRRSSIVKGVACPRQALAERVSATGESMAGLSRMLRRGPSYLHRFVHKGVPAALSEHDHQLLSDYFGVGGRGLGIRDLWADNDA